MRMQVDELPSLTPDVDYSQILPIQQKRTIAFVNHFLMNTVSYLNKLAQSCESRFMEFEYKIQKIESSLLILEAQLSSIPGCEEQTKTNTNSTNNNSKVLLDKSNLPEEPAKAPTENDVKLSHPDNSHEINQSENDTVKGPKAKEDPRYKKFFKMVQVGVPETAVKLKMQSEGVDPKILDNPDAIIPGLSPDESQNSETS